MKKTLSLILALVLCLGMFGCGNKSDGTPESSIPSTTAGTAPSTEPEAPQETTLYLNNAATLGNFEFNITYVRFVKSYTTDLKSNYSAGDGSYYIQIDYTVKNVSKTEQYVPLGCITADYNNGYIFEPFKSYKNVSENSTGVENTSAMAPLSDAVNCRTYIVVPEEVYTSENPLCLRVILPFDEEKSEAVFNMRPLDQTQQEAYYSVATELMNTAKDYKNYYYATSLFEALGDYQDSATLNEKAYLHWYSLTFSAGSNDRVNYFTDRLNDFPVVSGEEISTVFLGEWNYTKISDYSITIHEDGSISNYWSNDRTCRVDGDNWIMNNGKVDTVYEVRYVMDGVYLLLVDGKPTDMMIKV